MNSSNSWSSVNDQAVTSCVGDALRLGCSAVGFTIYPGSDIIFEQIEEFRHIAAEAKDADWQPLFGPIHAVDD